MERSLVHLHARSDFNMYAPKKLAKHVIFNIIKNAVQHVQKVKNPRISIDIDGDSHSISIRDNGLGISKGEAKRIFERFYTTARIGEGNGMGLSFCKIAIESLDGKIVCKSHPNEGTEFSMTFPAKPPKLIPRIANTPSVNW